MCPERFVTHVSGRSFHASTSDGYERVAQSLEQGAQSNNSRAKEQRI